MKKRRTSLIVALALAGTMVFNSCIGSFALTNKLLDWNRSLGNKWINELVFIVISPAYGVAGWIDIVILNTIEFWTDSNPVAMRIGDTQTIEKDGNIYQITKTDTGFFVMENNDVSKSFTMNFDEQTGTWTLNAQGQRYDVLQIIGKDQARVFLPGGETQIIKNDQPTDLISFEQNLALK